ncbi:MAG: hypothetical protein ABI456_09040 [Ktedonobacteraceae bacterium]
MHAVVSLLDEEHTRAIKELWAELERDFGVRKLSVILPYPHYSYQVARQYDEQQLVARTEELARRTAPFRVTATRSALPFRFPRVVDKTLAKTCTLCIL